jgi:hypothetical protein
VQRREGFISPLDVSPVDMSPIVECQQPERLVGVFRPILLKLNEIQFYFSDRINQASLKSFALAGGMDRIEKYESKINPDIPTRLGIA